MKKKKNPSDFDAITSLTKSLSKHMNAQLNIEPLTFLEHETVNIIKEINDINLKEK